MHQDIGRSLSTDYFRIADQLTIDELGYLQRTRAFADDEVLPVINGYWERAEFPWPLIEKLAKLGIVGDGIEGYGCPPMSALTEPLHGSDSVALETSARRDGSGWVINGAKKWIGNGTIADVVVVWARDVADGKVKGFLVEKGTPGYDARRIDSKGSLRAVWQAEIVLNDVRVPDENQLPGAHSFKDAGRVLAGTRNAVAWGALGHATAAYEVAVAYCGQRRQFGKPLASFQIVQDRLDFHVIRHMADIEAIHTYEGTETIQTLIVGRDITGVSAFA